MAKWSNDYPGQSGHIHLSLRHKDGASTSSGSAFYDPTQEHNMSEIQRQFVAGQQRLMPEFLSMIAPTVNSYTRLVPGFWAPTDATWGVGNPYLALAAALASGLYGIQQQWEPEAQVKGNAYEQSHPEHLKLSTTLWDAAQRFKASAAARDLFGDEFVDHYTASREWEEREYRKHISDWEMDRYFEII